jgi:polyisoprenoid-binding protein YceI
MISENEYRANGDLTIKGYTHEAEVSFYTKKGSKNMIAKLVFDRSKYDVQYGSGSFFKNLGDKLILDDIELEVTLVMM